MKRMKLKAHKRIEEWHQDFILGSSGNKCFLCCLCSSYKRVTHTDQVLVVIVLRVMDDPGAALIVATQATLSPVGVVGDRETPEEEINLKCRKLLL